MRKIRFLRGAPVVGVESIILVSISAVLQVQFTGYDRAALPVPSNIETRSRQGCSVPHQSQTESLGVGQFLGESDPVVANREQKFGGGCGKANGNSLCTSVLNRVRYRLLGDSIELSSNRRVADS